VELRLLNELLPVIRNWLFQGHILGFLTTFFGVGSLAPRQTPNVEDQVSIFISHGDWVAQLYPQAPGTHFSRILRHAWATVGLFFSPVITRGGLCSMELVMEVRCNNRLDIFVANGLIACKSSHPHSAVLITTSQTFDSTIPATKQQSLKSGSTKCYCRFSPQGVPTVQSTFLLMGMQSAGIVVGGGGGGITKDYWQLICVVSVPSTECPPCHIYDKIYSSLMSNISCF
jgi:hypothetical protein